MKARIDHVTDARDTRPAWGITYRRYADVRSSHVRIQADNVDHAMQALTEHIGNTQYAVTSIRPEPGNQVAPSSETEIHAEPEPLEAATSALYAASLRAERTAEDARNLAESLMAAAKEARAAYENASLCADALRVTPA